MSFRKITLGAILTSASALALHAQDVGQGAQAGGGAGVDAGISADANAGFSGSSATGTNRASGAGGSANVSADAGASAQVLSDVDEGTPVVSADGEVIGKVDATRTADDGRIQAVISVDKSANLAANRIAVDLRGLKQDTTGAVEYALSLAELRSSVAASVNANANADAAMND